MANPTGVYGNWYNEYGSLLTLTGTGTSISGTYNSAPPSGTANPLYGIQNLVSPSGVSNVTGIGWTVSWDPYASITSWAGQYQVSGTEEQIATTWLAVQETKPAFQGTSTHVGVDLYKRQPYTDEEIAAARRTRRPPHPID